MAELPTQDLVAELRRWRMMIGAIFFLPMAGFAGWWIGTAIVLGPGHESAPLRSLELELQQVQNEMRLLREELTKTRNAAIAPPLLVPPAKVIGAVKDKANDEKAP